MLCVCVNRVHPRACIISVAGREILCFGDFRRIGNDDDCRNILSYLMCLAGDDDL